MSMWNKCGDVEPIKGDYMVIMRFDNGSIETVHRDDYFNDITCGVVDGVQMFTKWWKAKKNPECTHWMYLPEPPQKGTNV